MVDLLGAGLPTSAGRNMSSLANNEVTVGNWLTEVDSAAALDTILNEVGLWTVHREVAGTLVQPRPSQIDKSVRIDRVLVPSARLLGLGWAQGIIGIEIKPSNTKIGQPIAQAMDYSRSTWKLTGGFSVWLDWVFIWPMGKLSGAVESVCCQHRIGSAMSTDWHLLCLQSGPCNLLEVKHSGDTRLSVPLSGTKAGRR